MGSEHFDAIAADWDNDEAKVARARGVADAVAHAVPLDHEMRLLEYGAGTGLVTQALVDRVGAVTLADNSAGMRAVIQEKIDAGVLPGARVWDLDLETQPAPDEQFEVVVTSLVLHHVRDIAGVLRRFVELLVPTGYLCIADMDREDTGFHGADFGGHPGFDRAELTAQLAEAGLSDVSVEDCGELVKDGVPYSVFMAVARRAV
ncbi:class I SAM-dependent methyltransferase [Georgenia faecalis]|uniref:Class I SAM-dependent methyltransferase n=1 Tax=Georgenia faecalis TaxID=2483799 RepID=A0ABV9DAM1_9MICO|nr:class I SAM-dependent methyltransferase [Georgenia faecalis]